MEQVTDEIYNMILNNLHITYSPDESTEERLMNEIASGIAYIKKYCNPDADFSPGTEYSQMLCDYVLRAESGATETFATDYAGDITADRIKTDVDKYAEAMGYA